MDQERYSTLVTDRHDIDTTIKRADLVKQIIEDLKEKIDDLKAGKKDVKQLDIKAIIDVAKPETNHILILLDDEKTRTHIDHVIDDCISHYEAALTEYEQEYAKL